MNPEPALPRAVRWAVLAACLAAIVAPRVHTFAEPIERDLASYAVTANELLHGERLYSEIWDHKPPAVHVAYAAAIAAFGYGRQVFFVLGVLAAAVTMAGVYRCARELVGDRQAGLWAAVFWSVPSSDLGLQANQPNVEAFMNACTVWAFALLLRGDSRARRNAIPIAAGCLAAAGTLFKPVTVLQTGLLLAGLAAAALLRGRREFGTALRNAAVVGLAVAAAWLLVGSWFLARGSWSDFSGAVFEYNAFYAGSLVGNLERGLQAPQLLPRAAHFLLPLAALSGALVVACARSGAWRGGLGFAGLALGTWLAVAAPGQFFPHYYQLWLPLLAIGGGAGLRCLPRIRLPGIDLQASGPGRAAAATCGAATLTLLLAHAVPQLKEPAPRWPVLKYQQLGVVIGETPEVARQANDLLLPGETFFHWGTDPGLYFYSGRRPTTVVSYCSPLFEGPARESLGRITLSQLRRAPPELVIARRVFLRERFASPVLWWIVENYDVVPRRGTLAFDFLVRRGGPLQQRLSASTR